MNWDAIGAIGDFIGAVAVVISLLYVGRQFRHSSTYALETIYFQTANNFSSSPENARVVRLGNADFASLTPDEQQHYMLLMHNLFSSIDNIFVQSRRGLMTDESADRLLKVAYFYFAQPGFRIAWEHALKNYYSDEFISAVESGKLTAHANLKTNLIVENDT